MEQRGAAFGKFYFSFFLGPLIGPLLGGALVLSPLSWRATFWFCAGISIALMLYIFLLVPETYRIEEKFSDVPAKDGALKRSSTNPIKVFLLLRHPFLFLPSLVSGITFGCLFVVETIIPELFKNHYNFTPWEIGKFTLSFI